MLKRHKKINLYSLCGKIHPEDGINPLHLKKGRKKNLHHKVERYCKQILQSIEMALASYSDPLLEDMHVDLVEELPNTSTLMVVFTVPAETSLEEIDGKYAVLNQLKGVFRSEIARVINRKRTPDLKIQIRRETEV